MPQRPFDHGPAHPLCRLGLGRFDPGSYLHELCRQHGDILQGTCVSHLAGTASRRSSTRPTAFFSISAGRPRTRPFAPNPIAPLNPGSVRPAPLASVTDGLSNTFAFGEKAHGKFSQVPDVNYSIDYQYNGAWISGNFGDTLFTALYPMNPFGRLGDDPGYRLLL